MNLNRREFLGGLFTGSIAALIGIKPPEKELVSTEELKERLSNKVLSQVGTAGYDGYVSLHRGNGTEPDDKAYKRQPVMFEAASQGQLVNANEVVFNSSDKDWGTIIYGKIWELDTDNVIAVMDLESPQRVGWGDTAIFLPGSLRIEI